MRRFSLAISIMIVGLAGCIPPELALLESSRPVIGPEWLSRLPLDERRGNRANCLLGDWELIQAPTGAPVRRITFDERRVHARSYNGITGNLTATMFYQLMQGVGSSPDYLRVQMEQWRVDRRPPGLLGPSGTGTTRIHHLTNNVYSYQERDGVVTYRKLPPMRHYVTVHVNGQHRIVPGRTPGHVFLELRSVDWPKGGQIHSYGTYGFYPRAIGQPAALRGPGMVVDQRSVPSLSFGQSLFTADHSITFELSDDDLVRVSQAIAAWRSNPPRFDMLRGPSSTTFVRDVLSVVSEPAIRTATTLIVREGVDPAVAMPMTFFNGIRDVNRDRFVTWAQVVSPAGYTPCLPWK